MTIIAVMSKFKRVMYYLGLSADEDYADYDDLGQTNPETFTYGQEPTNVNMDPVPVVSAGPAQNDEFSVYTPLSPSSPTVRPMPQSQTSKVQVLTPRSFQEVKEIGENLRREQPIIVNLQETQQDVSRRIVDFASGVCFALGGQMERVADLVYLLAPADVEINPEDHTQF